MWNLEAISHSGPFPIGELKQSHAFSELIGNARQSVHQVISRFGKRWTDPCQVITSAIVYEKYLAREGSTFF